MRTIILNSTNLVKSNFNNQFKYVFPQGGTNFNNHEIAVCSVQLYYSWFNINLQLYNNASLSYQWFDGLTYSFCTGSTSGNMPNMFVTIEEFNNYMQFVFIQNKHYLVNTKSGQNVYFLEMLTNSQLYSVQLNAFPLDTSIASTNSWTLPVGATWTIPTTLNTKTPTLIVPSTSNFKDIIGFTAGNYPPTIKTSIYSFNSNYCPQVTPVSSILVSCNLVVSPYSAIPNTIYSFTPDAQFGSQISSSPPNFNFSTIAKGVKSDFTITLLDQSGNNIQLIDNSVVIVLIIRESNENFLK